jgi:hypothetical protein
MNVQFIYEAAFGIWNSIIGIAMTLFTKSPRAAAGSVYSTTHTLYNAISDIALPITIVFFLIAICKDVISTPPEQQLRKFLSDALKLVIMIGILANLWDVMGYIMQIADGITKKFAEADTTTYKMEVSDDLASALTEIAELSPEFPEHDGILGIFSVLPQFVMNIVEVILINILSLLTSIVMLGVVVASSMSILNCAFQRILKPLVILPFASVMVAMASGSSEAERVATSYIRTFFGLCLSGAFMVIAVKLGVALTNGGLIAFDYGSLTSTEKILYITVQTVVTPLVIAGLVKQSDSMLGRFL